MDESSVEETAKQTNVMGMHFVRPPILDFNKIKDTNKYTEYEVITNNTTELRDPNDDNHLTNYLNSFIYCSPSFNIKIPKKSYMIKNGKKRFAYAVGMFPNPKTGKASYLDGCILAALGLKRQGTNADIICFITHDISEEDKKRLEVVFDKVMYVPYISPYEMGGTGDLKTIKMDPGIFDNCPGYDKNHPYSHVFFKLHIFNPKLFPYEKVCFVDSDLVPLNYYDSLFMLDCPAGWVEYRKKIPYLESFNWDRCDFLKHGEKIPSIFTDIDTPAGADVNAGLLLVEPDKKEYDSMIKELQQPIEKWMGKNKHHKGFYTFNFDTPQGNKFTKNSYCFPEQNYLTKRFSGNWHYIEFAFQSWALDPCNAFGIHMAAFNPKPWFKQPKSGAIKISKKYSPYVKDYKKEVRLPIALKEDSKINYENITFSYVIFNEVIVWGLVNYKDLKDFFVHNTEIHGKKISFDKDLFKPLQRISKGKKKAAKFKLLKDIDKDSPYFYKLSKTQQQISNLINDYDNHVEDIRGNYLEICKTKIKTDEKYNFKILQYPNYGNKIKINLLNENIMPFGKHKGTPIDDLPEKYIKYFVKTKLYLTNRKVRKTFHKSKHKNLIQKLNKDKIKSIKLSKSKSKSKSKSGGRKKKKRTKKRTKRRSKRRSKISKKSQYKSSEKLSEKLGQKLIINDNNNNNIKSMKKTLYYFYAGYCGYCKRFDPLWKKLKLEMSHKINFVKIDGADKNNRFLLNKYNIESYPTLTIKENNKKFEQERTEENIKNFINSSN